MILADLTLNLAAGLTQWLLEPQLDSWRRRISDPQRKAVEEVIQRSARRMLIQMEADLKRDRPDLGPGDFQALGEMLCDYFALPQAARALLEAAILGRPLDNERMHTHFRTVHGPERLTGIPFVLEGCLSLFLQHLGEEISRAAQDVESPLYNFWSVLVASDTHATAAQTLSEVRDIRLLLQQALLRVQSNYLWVAVPPRPAAPLLGRDDLLDDLVSRLVAGHSPALSTDGMHGVGKTALAVALAHDERMRAALPDGVLWGGLGQQPDVVTVQNQWAAALGAELADEPDVYRRLERLSRVLGDRRVLVVIDDAWNVEEAKVLRLSSPHAVHLLTTRDSKIARDFAGAGQQVSVPVLAPDPAYKLLERLAPEACAADPDAARRLVTTVGELPLALEVLGGYLAGHDLTVFPDLVPEAFAVLGNAKQRLALATERLGGRPGKRETLDAVIRLSVDALPPEASAAFWALGAFAPKPATFARAAAEAVTGAKASVLALLVHRNLVEAADGVLAVHQVVHDAMAGGRPGEAAARHRGYYLEWVEEDREDWRRIEAVYEQVRFAWRQMIAVDEPSPLLFQFVWRLSTYQERRGIWQDKLAWCNRAVSYARAEALVGEEASMLAHIGSVYSTLGDNRQALAFYEQALPLKRQMNDKRGEATTLHSIGLVYSTLDDKHQALAFYEQALLLRRQVGDRWGESVTRFNIAMAAAALGDLAHAEAELEEVIAIDEAVGHPDLDSDRQVLERVRQRRLAGS